LQVSFTSKVLGGTQLLFIRFTILKVNFSCFLIFEHFTFAPGKVIMSVESESSVVDSSPNQLPYCVEICLQSQESLPARSILDHIELWVVDHSIVINF
jgi:hypothetical protein